MAKIQFTLGANSFTFETDPAFPLDNADEVLVPTDISAGGQLYAYDKGIALQWFNLTFNKASDNDAGNVNAWCRNIAVGPKNTFTYRDPDGVSHTVRMMNTKTPLKQVDVRKWAGTITLRKEIL